MEKVQGSDTFLKRMKARVKDINNKEYLIHDLERFVEHIQEFHTYGESIHEENGYFFLVNDKFRESLFKLIK